MSDTQEQNPKAAAKAAKAYAKASRPWYRKKRWIAAIVIGVIIVAAALGSGGNEGATRSGSSGGGDADKVTQADPVKVGEPVELEGTRYTVESVKTSKSVGDEFFSEEAGGVYVIVRLTIENTKDETKTFSDSAAKFVGSNDKKYSTDNDGTFAAIGDGNDTLIFEDMQPDVPKTGLLVFDVPEAAVKGGQLEVSDLFGRGEAYVDLGL
jgi:hypothetical protein